MANRVFRDGATTAAPRWDALSRRISAVVNHMLKETGVSKLQLSKQIDYAHSTIVNTLNGKQHWSFPLLILVAEALEVPISAILAATEDEKALSGLLFAGTAPKSQERLGKIIRSIAPSRSR